MGTRGPLHDAAWELEVNGGPWITQAVLHPLHVHSAGFVSLGERQSKDWGGRGMNTGSRPE